MTHRTYSVGIQKDEFTLRIVERSILGEILESMAYTLCKLTRQRLCGHLCCKAAIWSDNREKTLLELPINREQADALAWHEDDWTWLDEDSVD